MMNFKFKPFVHLLLASSLLLSGCANLTGLENAQSDFGCSIDMPARCQSISEVYHEKASSYPVADAQQRDQSEITANARQKRSPHEIEKRTLLKPDHGETFVATDPIATDTPLMTPKRLAEEILAVWIAPFIDEEGDLHDAQRIYVTVKKASWSPEALINNEMVSNMASKSHWLKPLADDKAKGQR